MIMKTLLSIAGATMLLASAASAPLSPTAVGTSEASNIDQVRLVCNQYGRCWRTGPRYVYRGYDDGYYGRRSYAYYGGPGSGRGYYGGGPSIGFSFGGAGW